MAVKLDRIDRVLNKEHLYEKTMQKYAPKVNSRPYFNFIKKPKTAIACKNSFTNQIFWKRIIKKLLKR